MFKFDNLDETTRKYMLQELDYDLGREELYISPRLKEATEGEYLRLLKTAFTEGTPETLAAAIRESGILNTFELRNMRDKVIQARVPKTAHFTLAEGEFNRYYIRALCLRSLDIGTDDLQIYRAKDVRSPRSASTALIGTVIKAETLLEDLRNSTWVDTSLGVPAGPNSGLSVRLPIN